MEKVREIIRKWEQKLCQKCGKSVEDDYMQLDCGYDCPHCNTFFSDDAILKLIAQAVKEYNETSTARIFDENGKELGLYDIAQFFIETYPDDIFITGPYPIPEIRELYKKLLTMRKTA